MTEWVPETCKKCKSKTCTRYNICHQIRAEAEKKLQCMRETVPPQVSALEAKLKALTLAHENACKQADIWKAKLAAAETEIHWLQEHTHYKERIAELEGCIKVLERVPCPRCKELEAEIKRLKR